MGWLSDIGNFLTNRPGEAQQRNGLLGMGQSGQANFGALGGQLDTEADRLRRQANGQDSLSAEQLRQSLGQNISAQQAMAAGAAPQNGPMAALMASRNAMQLGSGLAGQQAMAGIAERNAVSNALQQMLLQRRQQEQSAAQFGYGQMQPGQSWLDKFGGAVQAGASLYGLGGFGRGGGGQSQRQAGGGPMPLPPGSGPITAGQYTRPDQRY